MPCRQLNSGDNIRTDLKNVYYNKFSKCLYLTEVIRDPFGDPIDGYPIFTCQTLIKRLESTFSNLKAGGET